MLLRVFFKGRYVRKFMKKRFAGFYVNLIVCVHY